MHRLHISLNGQQFTASLPYLVLKPLTSTSLSPNCGPAEGGTQIAIAGAALTQVEAPVCRFGTTGGDAFAFVNANGILNERLQCESPSAQHAHLGYAAALNLSSSVLPLSFLGAAARCGACSAPGIAVLTAASFSSGTVTFPAGHRFPYFEVDFVISTSDRPEDKGFSFSYASHLTKDIGMKGSSATGLSLSFRVWPTCELYVFRPHNSFTQSN